MTETERMLAQTLKRVEEHINTTLDDFAKRLERQEQEMKTLMQRLPQLSNLYNAALDMCNNLNSILKKQNRSG